jgi:uncharacterized repeat protein (TIGR03803 family)
MSNEADKKRERAGSQILLVLLVAVIVSLAFLGSAAHAQTYTLLYNFPGGSKGLQPGDIVVTSDGSILGVAYYGDCSCSLLFNYTDGTETVLHRFPEPAGYEREFPQGLLLSKNGDTLYGTTMYGGKENGLCAGGTGCGVAFSYDLTTSKYKTMHEFGASSGDGNGPLGVQVLDSTGDLYGLTNGGGTYGGTFYEITAAGTEKVLHNFGPAPDGMYPGWGPVHYGGNYYGVTIGGGANTCVDSGCGTVFKVTPSGKETVLYNFTGGSDGSYPHELVGDSQGNMYGISTNTQDNTTAAIFEINSAGDFSIAYNGSYVSGIGFIIMGTDGSLYASSSGGDDSSGAPNGFGQILRVTPTGDGNGTVTVLHEFDNTDGSMLNPFQDLLLHDGLLYGTTNYGGSSDNGVIYKLKP